MANTSTKSAVVITAIITCAATSLVWVCIGFFLNWSSMFDPPPFEVNIDAPNEVAMGESFEMRLTISNPTEKALSLGSIDIYEEFLNGFELGEVRPEPTSQEEFFGMTILYYSQRLEPGESFEVTIPLVATEEGYWSGDIDICTPWENYLTVYHPIEVVESTMGDEPIEAEGLQESEPVEEP